jgi:7-cyano-7-deazaguanine synthase
VPRPKAEQRLLLFSGGLDSTALAVMLRPEQTLTIDYGQVSAAGEIRAARAISAALDLPHAVLRADCSAIGSGLLAGREQAAIAPVAEWWPFRNQLLVTLAAAWAIPHGMKSVIAGSVAGDGAHADGTAQFYAAASRLLEMQEGAITVSTPAIEMSSAELLRAADVPTGLLGFTHSCHRSDLACGLCPGCIKRSMVLESVAGR